MNDLNRLFYWHGIAKNYFNYKGDLIQVPIENRSKLLRTMGVDVDSKNALTKAAFDVDVAPWLHWLPALISHPQNEPPAFFLHLNPEELEKAYSWTLVGQGEAIASGQFFPLDLEETGDYAWKETRYTRRRVPMGELALSPGYYELRVSDGKRLESSNLAIIPNTTWQPAWAEGDESLWGFIIQLYTLRSNSDWGIGDFSDLKMLIKHASSAGADLVGLNPLHTLLPDVGDNCSPYSPSDRRFLNPLYIDVQVEDDFVCSGYREAFANDTNVQGQLKNLREQSLVDYRGVKNIKYATFEKMYDWFLTEHVQKNTSRAAEFERFIQRGGAGLIAFGLYEAMYSRWENANNIIEANEALWRHPQSDEHLHQLFKVHRKVVRFHLYLQWLSEQQLESCQQLAKSSGMKLGLVRDLAVGANGDGCEVKSNSALFCQGASIGAPPDPFSDLGQNWGIPPMDPAELRASGYRHFIQLLRANMAACGALRIDHAMGLLRLWWCPPEESAAQGAYVYYPFEELLGLLKLESVLNQCAIIGEDLGVVPPEFREKMANAKVFANKVFYFEKEHYNGYKPPQHFDRHALAMVNNHDVPTLTSWWNGSDLKLREKLNLFEEGVDYQQMVVQRADEKQHAINLLRSQELLPVSWEGKSIESECDSQLISAILNVNSRVNSQIFVIQLEDLLGMDAPTNVPGTFREYPNWRRKLNVETDSIFSDDTVLSTLDAIKRERLDD